MDDISVGASSSHESGDESYSLGYSSSDDDISLGGSSSDDTSGSEGREDFQLRIRDQLESDDPELTELKINSRDGYFPHDGDWERDGRATGENTRIKELHLGSFDWIYAQRKGIEAFFGGLAYNKSIEILEITYPNRETFNMLGPFFAQNYNLRCLRLPNGSFECNLPECLAKFNTLSEFTCFYLDLCDEDGEGLIQAISGHRQMITIGLGNGKVGGRGMVALVNLLSNPLCSLADLGLHCCSISDESVVMLANAMAKNTSLRKLNLGGNGRISIVGWRALLTQLQQPQSSLEELVMWGNTIDHNIANLLANTLVCSKKLKRIDLAFSSDTNDLTSEDWRAVFGALQNPSCILQELDIHSNSLRDEDVTYLANSLANNCLLKRLNLQSNGMVTDLGWGALCTVFRNPNSALESVNLGHNSISDNLLPSFAASLVSNANLEELYFEQRMSDNTADAFSHLLCNESSIIDTYNSNHTLRRIGSEINQDYLLSTHLSSLFHINRDHGKFEAARRKIIKVHFSGTESSNMQPFVDMELEVFPLIIAWMAKDGYGKSLLFQFLCNNSFMFEVSQGTNTETEGRWKKRQGC